jgi:glycyl-tRNA synthetase alpha subunit
MKKIESEEEYQAVLKKVGELTDETPTKEITAEIERLSKMLEEYVDENIEDFEDEEREEEEVTYEWEKNLEDIM